MPKDTAAARRADPSAPPISFEGVRLVAYDGSTPTWVLRAKWVGDNAPAAHLDQVKLESYRGGRRVLVARAPEADFDAHSGILSMRGSVKVRSTVEHAAFSADKVAWNSASQHLAATGHVVFHRGVSKLTGERLSADSQLKRVRITGSVTAHIGVVLLEPGRTP